MGTTTAPLYFLAPGNPVIAGYRSTFEPFNDIDKHTLELNIHYKMVAEQDTEIVQQIIMALQHYPKLIHKLLFCLDFTFTEAKGSKLYTARRIWKQDPAYYRWFHRLMDLPFMLFFLHDEDMRYYALTGDMLADDQALIDQQVKVGIAGVQLTAEQLQVLEQRLFDACLSLLIFCHGSGFNPGIYVQGILSSFNVSFTYEDVLCEYAEDVLKGTFRVSVPSGE